MSFSAPSRERSGPTVPLASLVDILFLLLIFFIVTYSFREQEHFIDVSVPKTETTSPKPGGTQVVITVTEDGRIYMGNVLHTLASLEEQLQKLAELYPNETIVYRADQNSKFGLGIRVMDLVRKVGLRNLKVATSKKPEDL